ncbi:MAG TPA: T9SS type A sorting domain-containing protein, partial [Bacteroidia bacterium]|nr:T9SS type A sorting domain-containing protein [Bacteroidia bacterium]
LSYQKYKTINPLIKIFLPHFLFIQNHFIYLNFNRGRKLTSFEEKIYLMIKKTVLLIILFSSAFVGKGQNLVLNGDFEQFSSCPDNENQLNKALFWINPSVVSTSDYYNQCDTSTIVGVPLNTFGYQQAHSGVAYSGIISWHSISPDYREYIEASLGSTLTQNACYHFEMYVNLSDSSKWTTDDIGVYFSDTIFYSLNQFNYLPYTPQISNTTGFITDTVNWVLITGNYTASGTENYLIIGNFKDALNTDTTLVNINAPLWGNRIYFYIDDVCLVPCGSSCATAIEKQNEDAIKIYPNPVKNELFVNTNLPSVKTEIKITDVLGKEIYRNQFSTSNLKLQTSNFKPGIYFIEINNGKTIYRKKFLKE